MRKIRTVTEVARNFARYLDRVAFHGEGFVLVRGGRPVAELRPVPTGLRLAELPGLVQSLPRLSAEEAAAFERDWLAARGELPAPGTPWGS
ncbi:MAG: type II toxin-antitoxin system Phd/YefM family antitoxin [Gemmatimonadetes bacterium]|nr:type II toxin-antitoxin system Phd/YefM family antitoxin [Gemmatimonadota bacterium]